MSYKTKSRKIIVGENKKKNIRGRRGIAVATAGFLTTWSPLLLNDLLAAGAGPLPIPNPIGRFSRASIASYSRPS